MITINLTAQEIFDKVSIHLLTQNKRSINDAGSCMYRGPGELKCAAGCLIPDKHYYTRLEQRDWKTLVNNGEVSGEHLELILSLQTIHDGTPVKDWKECLLSLGRDNHLDTSSLDSFGETV